jgi:rod shape-determining protein MreD
MRIIPYIIYLLIVALHQVALKDITALWGAPLNMTALIVLAVALYKSEVTAGWFGFFAGLVMAAGTPALMGWHALILAAVGLAGYQFRERLNLESFASRVLFIFGGVLSHNVVVLIVNGSDALFYRLWANALPGAVYTTIAGVVFLLFKDGVITYKKFKSIF